MPRPKMPSVASTNARRPLRAPKRRTLATMALLHRAGRYDRATDDVEKITGQPPSTVGQYVAEHPELFS